MNDRQEKIYRLIEKNGSVSISQLKEGIYASEATIRRDLAKMESEGLLVRTWGGAVSSSGANTDPPPFVRSNTNVGEKAAIARAATMFLKNNTSVFLASGTTVAKLAALLGKFENLTLITNGLDTAEAITAHTSTKTILLGGDLYENYDLVGSLTEDSIERFNADVFFFSSSGITADGFTCMDIERLNIITKMKKNSQTVVLLCDSSKVGKRYTYRGFGFDEIDYVVMDCMPSDPALKKVLGKKLITPKSRKEDILGK